MEKNTRNLAIDIIKGLGIILMVFGHSGANQTAVNFVYLFHMPVFFIASGYCFNEKKTDSFKLLLEFIKRKFVSLYIPYVLWQTIFILLHNFFVKINVYTDNPLFLNYVSGDYGYVDYIYPLRDILYCISRTVVLNGHTQLGGAFWFIVVLFCLSILYASNDFVIKKIFKIKNTLYIQMLISIIFLYIGYTECIMDLLVNKFSNISLYINTTNINIVFSSYILFHLGFVLKKLKVYSEYDLSKHTILLVLSICILLVCKKVGFNGLGNNSYVNPVFLLTTSVSGWQLLYEIACFIKKTNILKKIIICIGQNTLSVVVLHFLSFKIVSYIGVLIKGEPLFTVAAFPVLYTNGLWWIAYLFVGLAVPVGLSLLYKKIKNIILIGLSGKMR